MNTQNSKSMILRAVFATLSSFVTAFAIAVATLAARPYVLPGQTSYEYSAAAPSTIEEI